MKMPVLPLENYI